MKTNRIKIEGIVFLAIASLLTTLSVASAQDERVLNLAYSTLTQEERELYLKTPEELKDDYVRSIRELAAGLFAPLGKETEPREYSAEEKPYVGESGTLTPEQVAAVKTFVDPRLENPPRALTDDEKKSVAQAFDLSDFDFRLRELAFESAAADFLGQSRGAHQAQAHGKEQKQGDQKLCCLHDVSPLQWIARLDTLRCHTTLLYHERPGFARLISSLCDKI